MSTSIKKVIDDSVKDLPSNIKRKIDNDYKIDLEKFRQWDRQPMDPKHKNDIVIKIVKDRYIKKVNNTDEALKKLIEIYQNLAISDIVSYTNFRFQNPDPQNFIQTIKDEGTDGPYEEIGKLIKGIFDNGNTHLSDFIPDNINDKMNKSLRYWQIYLTLVHELLQPNVDLSVFRSVNILSRYKINAFEKQHQDKKKSDKKKKKDKKQYHQKHGGKRFNPRKDKRSPFIKKQQQEQQGQQPQGQQGQQQRDKLPNQGRKIDKKQLKKNYENTLKNIKFKEENKFISLWLQSQKVFNCVGSNLKFNNKNELEDPIFGDKMVYTPLELKPLMNINRFNDTISKICKALKDFVKSGRPESIKDNNLFIKHLKYFKDDNIKNMNKDELLAQIPNIKDCYEKKYLINDLINEDLIKQDIIKYEFCKHYSIFVIDNLDELKANPLEYDKIRKDVLKFLIGYYSYNKYVMNGFISKLRSLFKISIKDLQLNTNKNQNQNKKTLTQKNNIENDIETLMTDKERKILEVIDSHIVKYGKNSDKRKKIVIIRDKFLNSVREEVKKRKNNEKERIQKNKNMKFKKIQEKKQKMYNNIDKGINTNTNTNIKTNKNNFSNNNKMNNRNSNNTNRNNNNNDNNNNSYNNNNDNNNKNISNYI